MTQYNKTHHEWNPAMRNNTVRQTLDIWETLCVKIQCMLITCLLIDWVIFMMWGLPQVTEPVLASFPDWHLGFKSLCVTFLYLEEISSYGVFSCTLEFSCWLIVLFTFMHDMGTFVNLMGSIYFIAVSVNLFGLSNLTKRGHITSPPSDHQHEARSRYFYSVLSESHYATFSPFWFCIFWLKTFVCVQEMHCIRWNAQFWLFTYQHHLLVVVVVIKF